MGQQVRASLQPLGALRSVRFSGLRPWGDEFTLTFENGARIGAVQLGEDGKLIAASPPLPAAPVE